MIGYLPTCSFVFSRIAARKPRKATKKDLLRFLSCTASQKYCASSGIAVLRKQPPYDSMGVVSLKLVTLQTKTPCVFCFHGQRQNSLFWQSPFYNVLYIEYSLAYSPPRCISSSWVPSSAIPSVVSTKIRVAFFIVVRRCAMVKVVLPSDSRFKDF